MEHVAFAGAFVIICACTFILSSDYLTLSNWHQRFFREETVSVRQNTIYLQKKKKSPRKGLEEKPDQYKS
jgi:hypothetical protein